jgi:hypothetical protein
VQFARPDEERGRTAVGSGYSGRVDFGEGRVQNRQAEKLGRRFSALRYLCFEIRVHTWRISELV